MNTPLAPLHTLHVEDGVALVTLNRPEVHNALNHALRCELLARLPELDLDDRVRVIVLTGAGERAFCTGADLKERSARTTAEVLRERHHLMARWASAVAGVSKPVIAAIRGYCMGGGLELVLQCDIALAAEDAVFALPEVTHGFFPGGGACQRLPRLIGAQRARELILTGRRWGAGEALAMGLVSRVLPASQVLDDALGMARAMATHPLIGLLQAKRAINQSLESGLTAGLRYDTEAWIGCMHSDEWKEKLRRFSRDAAAS